jgi:Tfp pilus assembly protein PilO
VRPWLGGRSERAALAERVAALRDDVDEHERVTGVLAAALETIDERVAAESVTLRSAGLVTEKLTEIGALAGEHGLVMDSMSPGKLEEGTGVWRVPITMRGIGRYVEVSRFVGDVRGRDGAVAVRGLQMSRTGDDAGRFEVEFVWFVSGR